MLHEEYLILINEEKIMFKTTLKITAFSLLSVLATASVQASQINQEGLRLVPTNTVLEGAPLYTTQVNEDKTVTTYFNTSKTTGTGKFQLLPTFSVQEGSALYSYQEIQTEETIVNAITSPVHSVDKSKLQLLPTYSVLEGDALYSYQEIITEQTNPKAHINIAKDVAKGKLRLLPTNSVLEGEALYSYQEIETKDQSAQVYAEVTKSKNKIQKAKEAC